MMAKLPREQLDRGVICSSAGNHAQGVALAAQRLRCDAVIVMPVTTPEIKVSTSLNVNLFSCIGHPIKKKELCFIGLFLGFDIIACTSLLTFMYFSGALLRG